jgi:DNA repair exonuclease SbcCD ATPase subunit
MKLLKLTTESFKRLGDFQCEFTDGLNIIMGENARGKSSLLQAIVAALYGMATIPGNKEDVPTWGRKNAKVMLTFKEQDTVYYVTRDLRNASISDGTKDVAVGNTNCTKFIEELLGLKFKDFLLFVLSRQGETSSVLTYGATELQKRVEEFSGADIIEQILKTARSELNILERNIKDVNPAELTEKYNTYKVTLERLKESIENEEIYTNLMKSKMEELQHSIDTCGKAVKTLRDASTGVITFKQRVSHLQQMETQLEDSFIKAVEKLQGLPELVGVAELETTLQVVETTIAGVVRKLRKLRALENEEKTTRELKSQMEIKKEEIESQLKELPELTEQWHDLNTEFNPAQTALSDVTAAIAATKKALAAGKCPTCLRAFEDHNPEEIEAELRDLNVQMTQYFNKVAELKPKLKSLETKIYRLKMLAETPIDKQLSASVKAWEASVAELNAFEGNEADLEEEHTQLRVKYQELETQLASTQELTAKHRKATAEVASVEKDLTEVKSRLKTAREDLLAKEQALAELNPENKEFVDLQMEYEAQEVELKAQLKEATNSHWAAHETLRDLKTEDATTKQAASEVVRELKQVKKFGASIDLHRRFVKFLTESRTTYLKSVWRQILGVASGKVSVATNCEITKIHRTEEGDFVAEERGKWVPIANCSGAQKSFIGVSLRIGLSSALYGNAGVIILDEPTESMSDKNALQLAGSLMGMSNQCLMITHRTDERLAAQNVIEVK